MRMAVSTGSYSPQEAPFSRGRLLLGLLACPRRRPRRPVRGVRRSSSSPSWARTPTSSRRALPGELGNRPPLHGPVLSGGRGGAGLRARVLAAGDPRPRGCWRAAGARGGGRACASSSTGRPRRNSSGTAATSRAGGCRPARTATPSAAVSCRPARRSGSGGAARYEDLAGRPGVVEASASTFEVIVRYGLDRHGEVRLRAEQGRWAPARRSRTRRSRPASATTSTTAPPTATPTGPTAASRPPPAPPATPTAAAPSIPPRSTTTPATPPASTTGWSTSTTT